MKIVSKSAHRARPAKPQGSMSILALTVIGICWGSASASATPLLGSDLASFTVLGASEVTNVPTSSIAGNVGVWPNAAVNAITGFNSSPGFAVSDPQVHGGTVQTATTTAQSAQAQLTTAITNLNSLGSGTLEPADLTGLTLLPGIYTVPYGTTNLSGTLTLDGNGNANAAWVFQMSSSLITSPDSVVQVINTGSGAGVYWNVRSSATIDTNTIFVGNILALTSISMNTTATDLCGRALAETGAVTLQKNSLSGTCLGAPAGGGALSGGLEVSNSGLVSALPYASVPEPATLSLLVLGVAGLGFMRTRRHKSTAA